MEIDNDQLWGEACSGSPQARERVLELVVIEARAELRRRGAPAEDLDAMVQDVAKSTLSTLKKPASEVENIRGFAKYRAWGILADYRKKQRASRQSKIRIEEAPDPVSAQPQPEESAALSELGSALLACCSQLTKSLAEVVDLRYIKGVPTDEIAERLGITTSTVHVRVFRAHEQLRSCLERKGFES